MQGDYFSIFFKVLLGVSGSPLLVHSWSSWRINYGDSSYARIVAQIGCPLDWFQGVHVIHPAKQKILDFLTVAGVFSKLYRGPTKHEMKIAIRDLYFGQSSKLSTSSEHERHNYEYNYWGCFDSPKVLQNFTLLALHD